jgi:hypothetical protein
MKMKAPIVKSCANRYLMLKYSGLENSESVMLTSANATNRFLERSYEKLSLNFVDEIRALALLSDTVFLIAELFVKRQP